MGIRDEELKRLILYAKGLGVVVSIKNINSSDEGEFGHQGKSMSITINKSTHTSKTELILTLLHELAHAKYFVLNGTPVSDGWIVEGSRKFGDKKLSKKLRKEIASFELNSLDLMSNIAVEFNIVIPKWKIRRQIDFDKWMYVHYLNIGDFASKKIWSPKWQELTNKYKPNKGR